MRKFWALVCVVGFTAFWTFGLIAVAALFSDRPLEGMHVALAGMGLFVGVMARVKVNEATRHVPVGRHVKQDEAAA
jgi:hypothetical protein